MSTTTTTATSLPPEIAAQYNALMERANTVASLPYQQYPGQKVADLTPRQSSAFSTIDQAQGVAQPFITQAGYYANQAAAPTTLTNFSGAAVQPFLSPFMQNVYDTTKANIAETNALQARNLTGDMISRGAFGGDRTGVAQAELARQQALAGNATLASLAQTGYQQAVQQFQNEQQLQLAAGQSNAQRAQQAAQTLGSLGQQALGTTLQGAAAQLQAGQMEQQNAQQKIDAAANEFANQQAYPFQTTSWLGNLALGVGNSTGRTQTTTTPSPSTWSQVAGAATAGLGLLGNLFNWKDGGAVDGTPLDMGALPYARGGATPPMVMPFRPVRAGYDAGGFTDPYYEDAPAGADYPAPHYNPDGWTIRPSDVRPSVDSVELPAVDARTYRGTGPAAPHGAPGAPMPIAPFQPQPAPPAPQAAAGRGSGSLSSLVDRATSGGNGDFYKALLMAGLGMMGGSSPHAAVNIGQGAAQGVQFYNKLGEQRREQANTEAARALAERRADMEAQRLIQQAEETKRRLDLETQRQATAEAARQDQLALQRQQLGQPASKDGMGPDGKGNTVPGTWFYDPNDPANEEKRKFVPSMGATRAQTQPPKIETFYDEKTGAEYKAQFNPATGGWDRVGGSKAAGDDKTTEYQGNSAGYAARMVYSAPIASKFEEEVKKGRNLAGEAVGKVWEMGGELAKSKEYQQYQSAKLDFITAVLRKESGAAIGKEEYEREDRKYFPQPTDPVEVVDQKRKLRAVAVNAMINSAGRAYKGDGFQDFDRTPGASRENPARPTSLSEYQNLPSGAFYLDRVGNLRQKGGDR